MRIVLLFVAVAAIGAAVYLVRAQPADRPALNAPSVTAPTDTGEEKAPPPADDPYAEAKAAIYPTIDPLDEKGFKRKAAPKPSEWLHRFRETPQTIERYRLTKRVQPLPDRRTIVLQPLGTFNAEQQRVLDAMRDYAEVFFQSPARLAAPIALTDRIGSAVAVRTLPPERRHGTLERQYDADLLMDKVLKAKLPKDAMVYIGITMEDLWSSDLNFVFGVASLKERVGVYSLSRYFPEFWGQPRKAGDETLALLRSCKVLNHETGHMFGLTHCVYYECSMNGSNSLQETDAAPLHFCPLCHRKLQLNLGFDPLKRFEAVRAFYAKSKLEDEAAWMARRIENWKALQAQENARRGE